MNFDFRGRHPLVIKIGTALLSGDRAFEGKVIEAVAIELCRLKRDIGLDIVIVTSGAVGCGMDALHMRERPGRLPLKQAVAAVGQATLMHYYETLFNTHGGGLHAAQVLLTAADLDNRQTYLNIRNTMLALFELGRVVPVVNENDSTAVDELRFGDNDTLSAKIAAKLNAGLLILLTDVDGLFDKNPRRYAGAQLIPRVDRITEDIVRAAEGAGSVASTGGMATKIEAARIAAAAGVPTVIANGHTPDIIHGVLDGTARCTLFAAGTSTLSHRKRWIAFGRAIQGALRIDEGARNALMNQGKSLLAAGIVAVEGRFDVGAAVRILDRDGAPVARALVNYSSDDIRRIQGRKTSEIAQILGHKDFDEVVHRDNMALV